MALQAAITILTTNAGGWAPVKRLLPALGDDFIAVQNIKLACASSATAAAALKATPWQTSWRDDIITAACGRSGGVALLARPWLDVCDISSELPAEVGARVAASEFNIVYCVGSLGPADDKLMIARAIAQHSKGHQRPWFAV